LPPNRVPCRVERIYVDYLTSAPVLIPNANKTYPKSRIMIMIDFMSASHPMWPPSLPLIRLPSCDTDEPEAAPPLLDLFHAFLAAISYFFFRSGCSAATLGSTLFLLPPYAVFPSYALFRFPVFPRHRPFNTSLDRTPRFDHSETVPCTKRFSPPLPRSSLAYSPSSPLFFCQKCSVLFMTAG